MKDSVAKLLSARRSLFIFLPMGAARLKCPRFLKCKKKSSPCFLRPKEVNLKRWLDRLKKRKRQKELREQSLVVSTKMRSTGSFVEWNEDKGLGASCSALVVSFPPWQSSFPSNGPYELILKSSSKPLILSYPCVNYCCLVRKLRLAVKGAG
jgi:hypothetical protein